MALLCGSSFAGTYARKASPGQTIVLSRYHTWNADCTVHFGTVTLVSKPRHGRLSKRLVDTTIGASKVVGVDRCYGKQIKSLEVLYTPATNFRGVDTISFDVTYRRLREFDTFNVEVQ